LPDLPAPIPAAAPSPPVIIPAPAPPPLPTVIVPAQPGLFTQNNPIYSAGMETLLNLGFSREMSDLALRTTRCNVPHAVNTLIDGWSQRMNAFRDMREMLTNKPAVIEQIIRDFEQTEPEDLGRQFRQHPEELIEWLGIDPAPFNFEAVRNGGIRSRAEVSITDDDRHAIERLVALGFPEQRVITVYFAAKRNEIVAANMLLGM
jgi:hypothetical protein